MKAESEDLSIVINDFKKEIRNKTITEFAERLTNGVNGNYFFAGEFKRWVLRVIAEIAEEMKGEQI